jgi:hypothetical protein
LLLDKGLSKVEPEMESTSKVDSIL